MTPRTSVRADARARFHELALQQGTSDPAQASGRLSPDSVGDGGEENETGLMARVRGLYEDGVLPVREIARLAGVTERTIYKYARKHGWRPRYRWQDNHPCMLVRGWKANEDYVPEKGAGGRFIRREDAGKPFARGLKALDPEALAKAAERAAEADRIARAAWQDAEHARLVREHRSAFRASERAADEIIRYREEHPAHRRDPEIEELLLQAWGYAIDATRCARLAVAQFEAERGIDAAARQKPRI